MKFVEIAESRGISRHETMRKHDFLRIEGLEFQVTRLAKPTDETYGKQMVAACKARTSPLPSESDSSQFPSTCSSLPLVFGCSDVVANLPWCVNRIPNPCLTPRIVFPSCRRPSRRTSAMACRGCRAQWSGRCSIVRTRHPASPRRVSRTRTGDGDRTESYTFG